MNPVVMRMVCTCALVRHPTSETARQALLAELKITRSLEESAVPHSQERHNYANRAAVLYAVLFTPCDGTS